MNSNLKLQKLKEYLKSLGSLAIAFSGGTDSTFLLKVASDVLGDNVLAITASSSTFPQRELNEAIQFAKSRNLRHEVIVSDELDIEGFADNPVNRCYLCKYGLFSKIINIAATRGIKYVADGSNIDDLGDYRPGLDAMRELGVISPLRVAGLTKAEIRELSKEIGLDTWDKPAFACLSSRLPYGQKITREKLSMIERAEQFLLDMGFKQVRVRHHGDIARIEVSADEIGKFFSLEIMNKINTEFKNIGFAYTALDLKGYRMGSMNETLQK